MEAEGFASQSRPQGTAPPPSDPDRTAGGASKYLASLPSRGLFSNTVPSSNLGGIRVYVCDHNTAPPDEQLIKTNTTNILIRALQINKQKSDSKDAATKATPESKKGKRYHFLCFEK
ncbi:putative Apurinic endonuclease-redox protein [Cocos nucifera]|nr:putative Apurinic endonuclease-redox protein [Cocos nucifera]